MGLTEGRGPRAVWTDPAEIIRLHAPQHPVMVFDPAALRATVSRFLHGFPGLVTYAVKANPDERLLRHLVKAGIRGFDVASPYEIDLIARVAPEAARHYHNPVRAPDEIRHAVAAGIRSFSVDSGTELAKLLPHLRAGEAEISVRFKLPVRGAAYDFGTKFGADPARAAELMRAASEKGHLVSMTFHPGTQCKDPQAWQSYIHEAARIAAAAGIQPHRLNVGGGFPSHRAAGKAPDLEAIFSVIAQSTIAAFGPARPLLVCEPGRALCADAFSLITRIKAIREDGSVFLNDGIYGALEEFPQIGALERIEVISPDGHRRTAPASARIVFGPTCDSLDMLARDMPLPSNIREEDFVIFHGAGAYSTVTNTRFNGFGQITRLTVRSLF
ncbi:type III PLP-dependent enzyme [Paracoccus ravus]|uniref:type III PLP-dependent enzyme n=1 Tax=Paracoccus ravus TaxID=2447760 RepID=UPI00106E675F|nr:type III PLP-dependent enzyme [Paracoccus ravus]